MIKRSGSAVWQGGLKDGTGQVSTASDTLSGASYSFSTRFENAAGTNPEELIAAAHSACFSMALSGQLNNAGFAPVKITTSATVHMEKKEAGFSIVEIALDVRAVVPGIDNGKFQTAANNAKTGCPVSRALNVPISLTAVLEQ